jgi:glycine/D-amino acid oxidase-like deaminating enzyme
LHTGADVFETMNAPTYTDTFYSRTGTCGRYQPLHFSLDADVAVVGGGLAGVNTAYSLAKRGKRVVLLEGGRIGWAASGRNGGFAHPGFSLGMSDMVAAVGESHTRALWQLSFDSLETIRGRVQRWAADGRTAVSASVQPGMLTASWFDDPAGAAAEVESGNRLLRRDYFQLWDRQRVRQACATDRYYEGVFDPDSFHFHSLDYAQEVARDAVDAGASIFERSPVSHISLARDGRKVVHTAGGSTVSAPDIVVAGSAYMPALTGAGVDRVRRAVLPVMTYACVTEPLGVEGLAQVLRTPHAITGE